MLTAETLLKQMCDLDALTRSVRSIPFVGDHFVESLDMVDYIEDWSRVRSPSRAIRRRRQGHRQNIVTRAVAKTEAITLDGCRTFYIHPETARWLRDAPQLRKE